MSKRFVLLLLVAGVTTTVASLGCSSGKSTNTVSTVTATVTLTPTPTPPSSNGSAAVVFGSTNFSFNQVAAECGLLGGLETCTVNWVGVVTTTGGASGQDLIINSLQLFTDQYNWVNGTLAESTGAGPVGTFTQFSYREDYGPGGSSAVPTIEEQLISSAGISFTLTAITGTNNTDAYSISGSGAGSWLLMGTAGHYTKVTNTTWSSGSSTGVLDSSVFN